MTFICPMNKSTGGGARVVVNSMSDKTKIVSNDRFMCAMNRVSSGASLISTGSIAGVATVNSLGNDGARALLLMEGNAWPIAITHCAADGSYSFARVPVGNYAVVIIDTAGNFRGKVIHTVVP